MCGESAVHLLYIRQHDGESAELELLVSCVEVKILGVLIFLCIVHCCVVEHNECVFVC